MKIVNEFKKFIKDMVFVQGGTFQMGSNHKYSYEKPVHSVTVSDFYIGKYEVTQKEWEEVMGNNPSCFRGDNLPIEEVSWYNAVAFCNKKSRKEGLTPCYYGIGKNIKCDFNANGYRLPTEAEWEYAARGGNKSKGYKYSGSNAIDDVAWYGSDSRPITKTHPVGTKQSNELGIYDMSGNVWEFCNDWYNRNYYSNSTQSNPKGPTSGTYHVLRGGSWNYFPCRCSVTSRRDGYNLPADCHSWDWGFRLVMKEQTKNDLQKNHYPRWGEDPELTKKENKNEKEIDVECERCGVIMRSCIPFEGRNLCNDCIKAIKCKPELNESICGNSHKVDNFWQQNENDNIVKLLEGE